MYMYVCVPTHICACICMTFNCIGGEEGHVSCFQRVLISIITGPGLRVCLPSKRTVVHLQGNIVYNTSWLMYRNNVHHILSLVAWK